MVVEFKFYAQGATNPYYSIKCSNCKFSAYQDGSGNGSELSQSISITPLIIGFKDWVNNKSFAWNKLSNTEVPY